MKLIRFLNKFIKNAHLRIPNIYVKEEKFKEIRQIAGVKEVSQFDFESNSFEWDTDISK